MRKKIFSIIIFSILLIPANAFAGNKLILFQQGNNNPAYVKQNATYIDTLPFNGIAISTYPGISLTVMDGNLHTYDEVSNSFSPVKGITWNRMKYNFGVINVRRPADFFDDWTNTIESFKNFAKAMKDDNIQGILFDNEEYRETLWRYPDDVKYKSKTLQEYFDQTRLRGKQVMEAIKSVYPDIKLMVLISPMHGYSKTPNIVDCWHQNNNLVGAFTVGMMEAAPIYSIIDGNESAYLYRATSDFDAAYQFIKYTMGSDAENVPFIPASLRSDWSDRISISYGLYNGTISACDGKRSINESTLRTMLEHAIKKSDEFVWQYWEGGNWYIPGGISQSWFNAVKGAWEAAGANVTTSSSTPTPSPTPTPTLSPTLKGDLNNDNIVNSLDWSIMNSKWFTADSTADLNADGIVNSLDFSIMNGNWLKSG